MIMRNMTFLPTVHRFKNNIHIYLNKGGFTKSILIFIILLLFLPSLVLSQANFLLSPPIIDIAVPPGGVNEFTLLLFNNSIREQNFLLYTTDLLVTPAALKFPEAGTTKFSCANWIEIDETNFSIEPGKSKEIKCRIRVPREVIGGRYAVIMSENVEPEDEQEKKKQNIAIKPHFRLGTIFKLIIKGSGLKKAGKIEDIVIEKLPEGGIEIKVIFYNQGNVHTIAKGSFIVKDKDSKVKLRGFFSEATSYPECQTEFKYRSKRGLSAGTYFTEAIINYSQMQRASIKKEFTLESDTRSEDAYNLEESISIYLDPSLLDVVLIPGSFKFYPITVLNQETLSAKIKISLSDFNIKENGEIEYLDSGSTPYSCADWVQVKPDEFEVKPGDTKNIRVIINPPKDIDHTGYVKLAFMINLFEKAELVSSGNKYLTVIVSTKKEVKEEAQIIEFETFAIEKEGIEFKVRFKNSGEGHLFPNIFFKIFNNENEEITNGDFTEKRLVLPDTIADIKHIHLFPLEKGEYAAIVTVKYGRDQNNQRTLSSKKVFNIK